MRVGELVERVDALEVAFVGNLGRQVERVHRTPVGAARFDPVRDGLLIERAAGRTRLEAHGSGDARGVAARVDASVEADRRERAHGGSGRPGAGAAQPVGRRDRIRGAGAVHGADRGEPGGEQERAADAATGHGTRTGGHQRRLRGTGKQIRWTSPCEVWKSRHSTRGPSSPSGGVRGG